jgi:uncharacterized membrane protein
MAMQPNDLRDARVKLIEIMFTVATFVTAILGLYYVFSSFNPCGLVNE